MYEQLNSRQKRAVSCLVKTGELNVAAKAAGVGPQVVERWLEDDVFKQCLSKARIDLVADTTGRLQQASCDAADSLASIIQDSKAPATARVSAIRLALDYSYRGIEIEQLFSRLDALEEQLKQTEDYPLIH